MCRHVRLHRRHGIYDEIIMMENCTYRLMLQIQTLSLYSSISTAHMSDRTQTFCDLNNGISFTPPGTPTCRLERLWTWKVRLIFSCLAYSWETSSYDFCISQSNLLQKEFRNSLMIWYCHVSCNQYDCL